MSLLHPELDGLLERIRTYLENRTGLDEPV